MVDADPHRVAAAAVPARAEIVHGQEGHKCYTFLITLRISLSENANIGQQNEFALTASIRSPLVFSSKYEYNYTFAKNAVVFFIEISGSEICRKVCRSVKKIS